MTEKPRIYVTFEPDLYDQLVMYGQKCAIQSKSEIAQQLIRIGLDMSKTDWFSERFRDGLSTALQEEASLFDETPELKSDFCSLAALVEGKRALKLSEACEAALTIGDSIGDILRESANDYHLGRVLIGAPKKRVIPPAEESAQGDELEAKLLDYISRMSEQEKRVLLASFESLLQRGQALPASVPRSSDEPRQEVERQYPNQA